MKTLSILSIVLGLSLQACADNGQKNPVPRPELCQDAPLQSESPPNCHVVYEGRCFESAELPCLCAGCPNNCLIMESYPMQISCGR